MYRWISGHFRKRIGAAIVSLEPRFHSVRVRVLVFVRRNRFPAALFFNVILVQGKGVGNKE